MSQFVVCEKCGRHAIRGVHTCSKCGADLTKRGSMAGGIKILTVGRTGGSKSEMVEQLVKEQFKGK